MSDKLPFYVLCAAVIILTITVAWNAHTINRLTDMIIDQVEFNGKVVATLSEQGALNNDQVELNDKIIKTLGVILK